MVSTSRMEQAEQTTALGGFGPHVEELREFFKSRAVGFGSAEDLPPFIERLESDAGFCSETASMVRAVIYRERDGLSRLELMELLATAVGGAEVDNTAAPEIREAVRKLMAFVEGVFRTRRNPGPVGGAAVAAVADQAERVEDAEGASAPHPTTDVFYRAQVVANGGVAETLAEERRGAQSAAPVAESAPVEDDLDSDEKWHIPLEDFAPPEPERGSRVWLWIAGVCALLLAFSAGLFVHQKLLVPLRGPNQPYEAPPAATQPAATAVPSAGRPSGTPIDADWRARASGRSKVLWTSEAVRNVGAGEGSAADADLRLRPVTPGTIGASPALMASYLVYAPPMQYPELAKLTHIQGRVMVEAVVGKSGQVIEARAISGHRLLRGAAVREVYERRYRPYVLDDRPRDVATIVAVDFRLK